MSSEHGTDEALKARWEDRARTEGEALAGVLFRGLPPGLNAYLDAWHGAVVRDGLLPRLPAGARVLDLGCGYGRIAAAARAARPDLDVVGLDFSATYCRLFRDATGAPAVCADIQGPPFAEAAFDGLVAVTALMYVPRARCAGLVARLVALLRPGGHALFVDPGREYMRAAALLAPGSARASTGGEGFRLGEYDRLGAGPDWHVVANGALPAFSVALPALLVAARRPRLLAPLLRVTGALDRRLRRPRRFSLHRWMVVRRAGRG